MPPPAETVAATDPSARAHVETHPGEERDLLSNVCHDLSEPLASIMMGTGFLRKLLPPDDVPAQRVVDAIHRAATKMGQRISSFSDLAKLEANKLQLEIRPYDVAAILQAALEQFLPDATARHVSVSLALGTDVPMLQLPCDRDRLLQTLRQLCACALRVVPEGATIALSAATDATNLLRFEVAARRSTASRRMGTALPKPELAIARGLIELHGGSLETAGDADSLSLSFTLQGATR